MNAKSNAGDHIEIFNELYDLFLMSITNVNTRNSLSLKLASFLTITPDQHNFLISLRKPEIIFADHNVKFGCIDLVQANNVQPKYVYFVNFKMVLFILEDLVLD